MKKLKLYIAFTFFFSLTSCDLVDPGDVVNPNLAADEFEKSNDALHLWVNGAKKSFAQEIGEYCELLEILSDNYYNNYTMGSKVFDGPHIQNSDNDVRRLQRFVGSMRESADYGLNVLAKRAGTAASREQLFTLSIIRSYSSLLAGENFSALPQENGGDVVEWEGHLRQGIVDLDKTLAFASTADDNAFVYTLKARAYRQLGVRDSAEKYAQQALALSSDMLRQVTFDGVNGVINSIQTYVWSTRYQPLPRLDFLDPKYFMVVDNEQRPISIAKSEENYLILAEAAVAKSQMTVASDYLKSLLTLVASRPTQQINDQQELRDNGGFKVYPDDSQYAVRASEEDPYRLGLVLDRKAPNLITIPTVSGTSVTSEMIDACTTSDQLLELIYLMRQEIFFAEGRRSADLGIKLPVCDTEAANTPTAAGYVEPLIPDFIPQNVEMDAFELDKANHTCTIKWNMNKVIVNNKRSKYVAPFFNEQNI